MTDSSPVAALASGANSGIERHEALVPPKRRGGYGHGVGVFGGIGGSNDAGSCAVLLLARYPLVGGA